MPRRRRFAAALVLVVALLSLGAHRAEASETAVSAGICAVAGSMSNQFSPSVQLAPSGVAVALSGAATCVGDPVMNNLSLYVVTNALLSCAGGEGTLAGQAIFSAGFPPGTIMTGLYVGAPGSETFELTGGGLTMVGVLAWSPTATATCPLSGTSSTPVYGTIDFVFD